MILCPYYRSYPQARATHPTDAWFVYTAEDISYWEALTSLWTGDEDIIIIEHDVEVHDTVVSQFELCPSLWCVFPHYYGPDNDPNRIMYETLGCVKFSARLQKIIRLPNKDINWWEIEPTLLNLFMDAGIRGGSGHSACEHSPWIIHHGTY